MIRDMQERDKERLKALHAADGFEWDFPEELLVAKVWVNEQDEPLMMIGAKVIAEAVLISSKEGTPGMRLLILQSLFAEVLREAMKAGIEFGITWIPDSIWKAYSRRLKRLGWVESKFRTLVLDCKKVGA